MCARVSAVLEEHLLSRRNKCLLLFTQCALGPGIPSTRAASLWMDVWPTQPAEQRPFTFRKLGRGEAIPIVPIGLLLAVAAVAQGLERASAAALPRLLAAE